MVNNKNKSKKKIPTNKRKRNSGRPYPRPPNRQNKPTFSSALSSLGSVAGDTAGRFISKLFGAGAYNVRENSIWNGTISKQVPSVNGSNEAIRFRHREFIGDINSTTVYTSNTFYLNPGLDDTFPYLAQLARAFQQYKFKGLVFEFKSTSANALNSTNTALGTVALAVQYRTDASAFTSKQEILNEMWAVDGKPSEDILLPVECDSSMTTIPIQYIRTGSVPSGQDAKLYDLGKVTVATVGSQATATVGELWVSYDVEFYKPHMISSTGLASEFALYSRSGATAALPFGSIQTASYDLIGITVSGTTISFPPNHAGKYHIMVRWKGTTQVITLGNRALTNCTYYYGLENHTEPEAQVPVDGVNSVAFTYTAMITIPFQTTFATFAIAAGGLYPSASIIDIEVVQLPDDY